MKWLLISQRSRRQAIGWLIAAVASASATGLLGGLAVAPGALAWGSLGFVSFVLCIGQSLKLWRVDEMVFDSRRRKSGADREATSAVRPLRVEGPSLVTRWRHV